MFVTEPAEASPLFGLPNVVCTPHLGASTTEAQENVALQVAEQMSDYLMTGAVSNALNMPSISADEALLPARSLGSLRKKKMPMWFNNFEGLEKVLRTAFNESASAGQRPFWLLLFEIYILTGRMDEFEELGQEVAVALET